jgi:hypothetical protein
MSILDILSIVLTVVAGGFLSAMLLAIVINVFANLLILMANIFLWIGNALKWLADTLRFFIKKFLNTLKDISFLLFWFPFFWLDSRTYEESRVIRSIFTIIIAMVLIVIAMTSEEALFIESIMVFIGYGYIKDLDNYHAGSKDAVALYLKLNFKTDFNELTLPLIKKYKMFIFFGCLLAFFLYFLIKAI